MFGMKIDRDFILRTIEEERKTLKDCIEEYYADLDRMSETLKEGLVEDKREYTLTRQKTHHKIYMCDRKLKKLDEEYRKYENPQFWR